MHDLVVLADEIYTDYMYETGFLAPAGLPGMAKAHGHPEQLFKNYLMTGWRIGHIIAEPPIVAAMKRVNENLVYSAPSVSQRAALHALRLRSEIGDQYTAAYKERVFYAAQRINAMPAFSVRPPQGTFYLFMNIQKTGMDSIAFCQRLVRA